MAHNPTLTIGRLARAAGVNVETVRYYQRRNLMSRPGRYYAPEQLARLRFIKRAQELGFTLKEIAELLKLDGAACGEARGLAERKRADIEARLKDLTAMRKTLDRLLRACASGRSPACPIIESLYRRK
ncbi:MAG: MerR family transcriptional regulator [Gammaproteobacteria bacterium]|nr:MAG: MerR family transcriptional regulator [Gammaproteobacteria bacterium]